MIVNWAFGKVATVASVFVSVSLPFFAPDALATPTRIDCALTNVDGNEPRAIRIVFDSEKNTLVFYEGPQASEFGHVTISTVSINGNTDHMSIGIDRSSWLIVIQTYSQDQVSSASGVCRPSAAPSP